MTPAAPPEKMLTEEQLQDAENRNVDGLHLTMAVIRSLLAEIRQSREAARLAPRVGDEGVTPELRRAWLERLLAEAVQWIDIESDDPKTPVETWLKLARSATKHLRISALPKGQEHE